MIKAVHKESGETVAIKMIQKKNLDSEDTKNIFGEVKISGGLEHPNVVKMLDAYESPQAYFIVFEIMSGGEVDSKTKKALRQNLREGKLLGKGGGEHDEAHH